MPKLKSGFKGERSVVLPKLVRNICQNDTFLSQLYITDIGYYPNAVYHYRERPKGVAQWILIYCLKGSGWYSVRGHHYEVKENQWFVIPKSEPHVYASNDDNPWTIYWIHLLEPWPPSMDQTTTCRRILMPTLRHVSPTASTSSKRFS